MDFWRKILILAIIVLSFFILYKLIIKRSQILQENAKKTESFTALTAQPKINSLNLSALSTNNGITNPTIAKRLKQFVIKASYHTAYTGTDLSASMVSYALSRGYRWLHFCVNMQKFENQNALAVVYTKDDTSNGIDSIAPIQFSEVINNILQHSFVTPDSPNNKDPIFVQIVPLDNNDNTIKTNIHKVFKHL
jgi:hypothetical protein